MRGPLLLPQRGEMMEDNAENNINTKPAGFIQTLLTVHLRKGPVEIKSA